MIAGIFSSNPRVISVSRCVQVTGPGTWARANAMHYGGALCRMLCVMIITFLSKTCITEQRAHEPFRDGDGDTSTGVVLRSAGGHYCRARVGSCGECRGEPDGDATDRRPGHLLPRAGSVSTVEHAGELGNVHGTPTIVRTYGVASREPRLRADTRHLHASSLVGTLN
jgi:hypothetical protein